MKCEVRGSCRNEAELWIHLNGKPKRSCVACSTRVIREEQVVESHWHAPLDGPCPTAEHRALTPTERADIIAAEDRAHGQAIPLPPPTEETEARLPSSDSPPTAGLPQETDMGSKPLTLTLRPDADAHPELCRVAECLSGDKPPKRLIRGLCEPDYKLAHRAGRLAEFALSSTQGQAKPKPETPLMPMTASEPDVVLSEGDALRPIPARTVQADPPPAPPPPAVVELQVIRQSDDDSVEAARAHLRAALSLTPYATELPDGTPTAKAGIAVLADVAGAWLKGRETRLQDLLRKAKPAAITAPAAPIPPAVDERLTRLNAELAEWRDLADRQHDALGSIAEALDCEYDPDKPIGPQLVQRAQNLLNLNKEWEAMRDEARAAYDRSQNELLALASEVKHLSQRAELAEDAAAERRYELDTALQTYADLRAKLCQIFGEDPAELTDLGIVDKATMAQHWWGKTVDEFKAFRFAVAELVDVEEEMADPVYLRNVLRNALEQPQSYGPFRVDSAVCVPSGRNQATLTWAQGDARLLPVGSLVRLTVVEVLGG